MKLFSDTMQSLENALDYSSQKQSVISQNIANVDTPNYKAKDVSKSSFSSELETSIQANRTDVKHIDFTSKSSSQAQVVTQTNVQYNSDGNSVDVDKEMSDLATNQIYYNALIERTSSKYQSLLNVIKGGN